MGHNHVTLFADRDRGTRTFPQILWQAPAQSGSRCQWASRGFGLADLLREINFGGGAAGVAMPVGYWLTLPIVAVERIRRVAVHVFPRVRGGFHGARQTQNKTESRLLVLVLVERLLRSA